MVSFQYPSRCMIYLVSIDILVSCQQLVAQLFAKYLKEVLHHRSTLTKINTSATYIKDIRCKDQILDIDKL